MSATPQNVHDLARFRQARDGTEAWATKQEVARHYGYSVRWVEMRVRDGLPFRRIGGRMRFQLSSVDRWLAQREAS